MWRHGANKVRRTWQRRKPSIFLRYQVLYIPLFEGFPLFGLFGKSSKQIMHSSLPPSFSKTCFNGSTYHIRWVEIDHRKHTCEISTRLTNAFVLSFISSSPMRLASRFNVILNGSMTNGNTKQDKIEVRLVSEIIRFRSMTSIQKVLSLVGKMWRFVHVMWQCYCYGANGHLKLKLQSFLRLYQIR